MRDIKISLPFKMRWKLYKLSIKLGHPDKSRLRIALEGLKGIFKAEKTIARFG